MFETLKELLRREPVQLGSAVTLSIVFALITSLFGAGDISCGDSNDLIALLDSVESRSEGNQVAICIVDGLDADGRALYDIHSLVPDQDDLNYADRSLAQGIEIETYISFFKITEQGSDQEVTSFPKGIEIYVFYSEQGAEGLDARNSGLPQVAALVVEENQDPGVWELLGGTEIKSIKLRGILPGPFVRVVVFKYFKIPDPLIGGC